jgi:putative endonuclease
MSFWTYVIRNQDTGKIYIGQSSDPEMRLKRHNCEIKGRDNCYTHRTKGLWGIVYKEEFGSRAEAIKREKELKSYRGREFIKNYLGR